MNRLGCFTLALAALLAAASPLILGARLDAGLEKLGVPWDLWVVYVLALAAGSAINLPVWKRATEKLVRLDPFSVIGLEGVLPNLTELRREARIAVNVGGGLLPLGMAVYQVIHVAGGESAHRALIALALATAVDVAACWKLARAVPAVGILVPGLIPPLVAAAAALLLQPGAAPPVELVAGTMGPIAGSVLRFADLRRQPVALASVGGAGVFDAVFLATVVAPLLG